PPLANASEDRSEQAGTLDVLHQDHEMTELLHPIITRTAVTLGINVLVAGGVSTAEAIAAELGIAADRAQAVLTAMCSLRLLTREEQDSRTPPTGPEPTGEGAADGPRLDSPA